MMLTRDSSSCFLHLHYDDVTMGAMASQITIVYSTVSSGADQRKHQSSASMAFAWGIHQGPMNSPHKWQVTRKMFPFDDVTMCQPIVFYQLEKAPENQWVIKNEIHEGDDKLSTDIIFSLSLPRYSRSRWWKDTMQPFTGRHQCAGRSRRLR